MTDVAVMTLFKEAIKLSLFLSFPLLFTALIVGLAISIFQAVTQIQEMTLTFVPKILTMALVLFFCIPWFIKKIVSFTENLILNIPGLIK